MSRFIIGQKIMCIKAFSGGLKRSGVSGFNIPKLFHIYTVRAYCPCSPAPAILLEELVNREVIFAGTKARGEASFAERFFAPLEPLIESKELETTA